MKNNMNWNFDNSYSRLSDAFKEHIEPIAVKNPELVLMNEDLIEELNLDFSKIDKNELAALFTGNILPEGSNAIAQAYAGHQFGHFTILGDGRALLLGEHINNDNKRFDIQLKGSGQTPYSRNGDGKAALGPMIREYLVSEAMNSLNISSTRALAIIVTGERILREKYEPGAILVRVAQSHLRVGTFQFGSLLKNTNEFKKLINYTINRLYPEIKNEKNKYIIFFKKICKLQINLIIDWLRVGFIHGVMNTDNMSLSGETIDYGPCAFMDNYNPKTVFSSIDSMGRYSYDNQSKICLWNLARFAETFLNLIDEDEKNAIKIIEEILNENKEIFYSSWLKMMSKKLNLEITSDNSKIIKEFLDIMHIYKLDYTNTFVDLENKKLDKEIFKNWLTKYTQIKLKKHTNINPIIIPRNHIIEKIINDSYKKDFSSLIEFNEVLKKPYEKNTINKKYTKPPKENEKVFQTFCGT
mgnify:CR=1 FL=1